MLLTLLAHSARLAFTLDLPPAASIFLQTPVQWMEYVNKQLLHKLVLWELAFLICIKKVEVYVMTSLWLNHQPLHKSCYFFEHHKFKEMEVW